VFAGKRKFAIAIVITLLVPSLFMVTRLDKVGAVDIDVRLYMHGGINIVERLNTETPQGALATITSGTSIEYPLEYPIARDMMITGPVEGGSRIMILHLQSMVLSDPEGELTVEVNIEPPSSQSILIAKAVLSGNDLDPDDLAIPFIPQGQLLTKGTTLKLVLSYTGSLALTFSYGVTGPSYLSFQCTPILEDGVRLSITDLSGNPVEEVIPYGPEEARTVRFISSASSGFGANDIGSINLLMVGSQDNILMNVSTEDPVPGGGEEWTYFNHTFVIPEGAPTDTYTITATAISRTGYTGSYETELIVAPGLFLTVDDAEKDADAGDTVTFVLDVLNGGDAVDRVTLSAVSQLGWAVDSPDAIEIEGGDTGKAEFRVYVPLKASVSTEDTITLQAGSRNAGKDYNIKVKVFVKDAATFGVETVGDTEKAVIAGTSQTFQVRVLNLLDENRTFEMSTEEIPSTWTVGYYSDGGDVQSGLFVFQINGSGEEIVDITVLTSSAGPFGSQELGSHVRARGDSVRKWAYHRLNVVNDEEDVVNVPDGVVRKTSGRIGTDYPVKYSRVYFTLFFYNPTLSELDVGVSVEAEEGWEVDVDYEQIGLSPGEGSLWNLTVTPETGGSWNLGSPYFVDVDVDAGDQGEFSRRLEIVLPEVSDVRADREWTTVDTMEGNTVPLNITFRNRGNRDETVRIIIDAPPELTVNMTPLNADISPGEDITARGQMVVGDIDEAGTITLKVRYQTSRGEKTLDYSLTVEKKAVSSSFDPLMIGIIVGVVIVVLVAALVIYNRFFAGKQKTGKGPEASVPAVKAPPVTVSAVTRSSPPVKARPGENEEVIRAADEAMASILGGGSGGGDDDYEKVEVVEATVVE